jgi:PAS domain S-box-containing protein
MNQSVPRRAAGAIEPRHDVATPSEGPGLRTVLVVAPTLAFAVGVIRVTMESNPQLGYLAASIGVPLVLVILLALGVRRRDARPLASAALFVEAVLAGAFLPAGLAVAAVLPIIGVTLIQGVLRERALAWILVIAGGASTTGIALAVLVGPARGLFGSSPALLTIGAFIAIVVFALALVWRSTHELRSALDHAQDQISARGAAELELDRATEILSAIVRSSPVATIAFAHDRRVTLWNRAAERTFGWKAEEVLGGPLPEAMVPDDARASWAARIDRTIGGAITNGDRVRRQTKDGRSLWIDIYAAPLRDRTGRSIGIAGQLVDVSDRVELEAQLLQAQKMETIGLLASGIAHDFNNTLTAAGGFAALIDLATTDEGIRTDAREILAAVERARLLTRKLLAFGRQSEYAIRSVDARAIVSGLTPLIRQLIGPETEIRVENAPRPAMVRIDTGQLEQALINLAVNARDAMPGGGRLTLGVRPFGPGIIEISVRDSGTGIPVELRDRIFEPFFTTKAHGFGSGLGLPMVRGFTSAAGGVVTVESEVGIGTTFHIRLPEVPEDAPDR